MPTLTTEKLLSAFIKLGDALAHPSDQLAHAIALAQPGNAWFTPQMIDKAVKGICEMLNPAALKEWFRDIRPATTPKRVGLILAGNIPLVGFHDVLCVLASGHIALIKLSSSDDKLLPAVLAELTKIEPALAGHILYTERLKDFDAVIATGSNNSSRYFDYYFSKTPHIIRKNRNSVAVLTGTEQDADIALLGHDIFDYFGLGCRNVSKIYIPEDYTIKSLFEPLEVFQPVIHHFKYHNNYDYNKSIYLVNRVAHFDNGFLLLKEDVALASPLAVVFYEKYKDLDTVCRLLEENKEDIQCVAANVDLGTIETVGFGKTQAPQIGDYADNINTITFLSRI